MIETKLAPFGIQFDLEREGLEILTKERVLEVLENHQLLLVRGLPPLERETFLKYVLTLTPEKKKMEERLLHWDFGPVMELNVKQGAENYLFSHEAVPFHWDGAFHIEPSYLVFNCIHAPEEKAGGETLFTNSEKIYQDLNASELDWLAKIQLTYKTEKKAHYGGEVTVPILQKHPKSHRPILRYPEDVETKLNPVSLEVKGRERLAPAEFKSWMKEKLYHSKYMYTHQWQKGDLLIADNFSTVHGRYSFLAAAERHIRRIQIL